MINIAGQKISPQLIAGQIGENVVINCTSHFPNEALTNIYYGYIYKPEANFSYLKAVTLVWLGVMQDR